MSARIFSSTSICSRACINAFNRACGQCDRLHRGSAVAMTRNTISDNAKSVCRREILSQSREGSLKALVARFRCAQPTQRISTFFSDCTHQLQDPFQERFGGRVLRELVFSYIKLERGAQNTLQQRVMQFLRNPRTFGEPLLETNIQSFRQLMNAQAINRQDRQATPCKTSHSKPPRLPERRFDTKGTEVSGPFKDRHCWRQQCGRDMCQGPGFYRQPALTQRYRSNLDQPSELIAKTDAFSRGKFVVIQVCSEFQRNLDGVLRVNLISASEQIRCELDSEFLGDDDRIGQGQTRL